MVVYVSIKYVSQSIIILNTFQQLYPCLFTIFSHGKNCNFNKFPAIRNEQLNTTFACLAPDRTCRLHCQSATRRLLLHRIICSTNIRQVAADKSTHSGHLALPRIFRCHTPCFTNDSRHLTTSRFYIWSFAPLLDQPVSYTPQIARYMIRLTVASITLQIRLSDLTWNDAFECQDMHSPLACMQHTSVCKCYARAGIMHTTPTSPKRVEFEWRQSEVKLCYSSDVLGQNFVSMHLIEMTHIISKDVCLGEPNSPGGLQITRTCFGKIPVTRRFVVRFIRPEGVAIFPATHV